jgi:hypothetical protein
MFENFHFRDGDSNWLYCPIKSTKRQKNKDGKGSGEDAEWGLWGWGAIEGLIQIELWFIILMKPTKMDSFSSIREHCFYPKI